MGKAVLVVGGCGYVGSALVRHLGRVGYIVESIDLEWRGNPGGITNARLDYRDISQAYLRNFEAIVLLAAHAGIREADEDRAGAISNNVLGLHGFLERLEGQQLIYASTARLYEGSGGQRPTETARTGVLRTMYDITKLTGDLLVQTFYDNATGLRFGTVSGPSPNYRSNVMVNCMVAAALSSGSVTAGSPEAWRPVLALSDLVEAVAAVIDRPGPPGLYNLASFNTTVGNAARAVGDRAGVPVVELVGVEDAGFSMDVTKFEKEYGFAFQSTLESLVNDTYTFALQRPRCVLPLPRSTSVGV